MRPGLSLYSGYDGIIRLDSDIHALHGRYQMEIGKVTEQAGSQVTVQATIHPEPGRGQPPLPVTSIYIVRDGRTTSIDSLGGSSAR